MLPPASAVEQGLVDEDTPPRLEPGAGRHRSEVEQQVLPIDAPALETLAESGGRPDVEHRTNVQPSQESAPAPKPERRASPYAENL